MLATEKINTANLRFASYYLSRLKEISRTFEIGGDFISSSLQRFEADYPQIERILSWLADHYTVDEIAPLFLQLLEVGYNIFSKRLPSPKLLSVYQQGLQVAHYCNNTHAILLHQLAIADVYLAMNNIEEAIAILEQILPSAEQIEDKTHLSRCLVDLAFAYTELSREKEAILKLKQAIVIYRELNDRQNEINCLYRLAQNARRKGDWDIAQDYLNDAYRIVEQYENQAYLHKILRLIGEIQERQGHLAESFEYKMRALEIAQQLGNQSDIVFDMIGLGISNDMKGDFTKAQEYYRQGLKIANKMGFERQKSLLIGNLGYSAYMQRDYHSAVVYMQESLQMVRNAGQEFMVCVSLANLVPVYIALADTPRAQQAVYEGLEVARKVENNHLQTMMMVAAVQYYVFEALKLEGAVQHEIMTYVVRWSGFIYASSYADQENRGELDTLRPRMEQVLDTETIAALLADGSQIQLEQVYEQILSLKNRPA
jgi:tetratricopeptide (TPR) repeat protein